MYCDYRQVVVPCFAIGRVFRPPSTNGRNGAPDMRMCSMRLATCETSVSPLAAKRCIGSITSEWIIPSEPILQRGVAVATPCCSPGRRMPSQSGYGRLCVSGCIGKLIQSLSALSICRMEHLSAIGTQRRKGILQVVSFHKPLIRHGSAL